MKENDKKNKVAMEAIEGKHNSLQSVVQEKDKELQSMEAKLKSDGKKEKKRIKGLCDVIKRRGQQSLLDSRWG